MGTPIGPRPPLEKPRTWVAGALCRDTGTDLFFPLTRNVPPATMARVRDLCFACPVRLECLRWAVEHRELGLWAGTTEDQREGFRAITCRACRAGVGPEALVGRRVVCCAACRTRWVEKYGAQRAGTRARRALSRMADREAM